VLTKGWTGAYKGTEKLFGQWVPYIELVINSSVPAYFGSGSVNILHKLGHPVLFPESNNRMYFQMNDKKSKQ